MAAVAAAKRVAAELSSHTGYDAAGACGLVGYRTRDQSSGSGKATAIEFVTDGVLLAEARSDVLLQR